MSRLTTTMRIDPDQTRSLQAPLFEVIQGLLAESRPAQAAALREISLDTDFDRDLGMDSLARVELLSRIERRFGVRLEDHAYYEAGTPRALLQALASTVEIAAHGLPLPPPRPAAAGARVAPAALDTLTAVLEWHAEHHPERVHIRFYEDEGEGKTISYNGLLTGARRMAGGLQSLGLEPGEPVVLMLQSDPDYFFCFFGVLLAGGIPVPIYPPARPDQIEDHLRRQMGILENCRAPILVTMPEARGIARLLKSRVESLRQVVTPTDIATAPVVPFARPAIQAGDIAFLQYTSGSTGSPKGVMLSHANLLANIRAMANHIGAGPDDVFVSWLPLYHDLGLIGGWFGSLYCATELVVMSPLAFITRPQRWLHALHRYRGTISAAPNFAYELCLRRLEDRDIEGLDLGSWRIACNGAEPVSPETMLAFRARFARYGLRGEALMPVYGLAESSVGLTFPPLGRGLLIDTIRRDDFQRSGHALPAAADDRQGLRFVSCGAPLAGHEVRIVDDAGREIPERENGRLQFRGPSSTPGYYRNAEATTRLRQGDWLDSGDLAYIAAGEVYLTGRAKDIIIHAGRNLYPHEIEEAVGQLDGIRAGRVAAFGVRDPGLGSERLIIVAETRTRDPALQGPLRQQINTLVATLSGGPPDDLVLAPPGAILKTPSGKIRRTACRDSYLRGEIGRPRSAAWRQVLRIAVGGLPHSISRGRRLLGAAAYSAWTHALYWPTALLTWSCVVCLLPNIRLRWAFIRQAARFLALAAGVRVRIEGTAHLPPAAQPCIFVANHASYLDALVLIRALPDPASFVAKAELRTGWFTRLFLERIGAVFVERFDARQGASDAQALARRVRAGARLLLFPEGTFTRAPGLRPFRMGAFTTAADTGTPIVPLALRGTRSLLRDGSHWPHRGEVTVTILPAIDPARLADQDPWGLAVELRDRSRAALLQYCGEPALEDPVGPGANGGANQPESRR